MPFKPSVLAILPGIMPSTLLYVVKPLLRLEAAGWINFQVMLENYPHVSGIEHADVAIFCRNAEPRYQYALESVLKKRIPFIYNLDDNFFEIPPDSEDGQYYRDPERSRLLTRYLQSADLVRVYSHLLYEKMQPLYGRLVEVTPPFDWSLIQPALSDKRREGIQIVYATSRHDDYLHSIFAPALKRVLEEYTDQVEMCFWGLEAPDFKRYPNVHFRGFTPNYDRFMKAFSRAGFEIGLAPLQDDEFHRSKTNTKFRDYGACGIAGIYSSVSVYTGCVIDEESGLLVPNDAAAWQAAITRLVREPALRTRIGQAARKAVQSQYSYQNFQDEWWMQIQAVLNQVSTAAPHAAQATHKQESNLPSEFQTETRSSPIGEIWFEKLRRAILLAKYPGKAWENSQIHMRNWWWLFKLNVLKHI